MDGFVPGSVGALCAEIDYDVRELWVMGYTNEQIDRVRYGEWSIDELLRQAPAGPSLTISGSRK